MPKIDDPEDPTSQITGSCPCPALPEGMVVVRRGLAHWLVSCGETTIMITEQHNIETPEALKQELSAFKATLE